MEKTLINLIPETAKYIGDFYKENEYYCVTIEVPKETSIEFKTKEFEIVSIENKISVFIKLKIGAHYLEYLSAKELNKKERS